MVSWQNTNIYRLFFPPPEKIQNLIDVYSCQASFTFSLFISSLLSGSINQLLSIYILCLSLSLPGIIIQLLSQSSHCFSTRIYSKQFNDQLSSVLFPFLLLTDSGAVWVWFMCLACQSVDLWPVYPCNLSMFFPLICTQISSHKQTKREREEAWRKQ